MAVDGSMVVLSVWLAYFLRVGEFLPLARQTAEHFPLPAVLIGLCLAIPTFVAFGLYRVVYRFSDTAVFLAIGRACAVYSAAYILIFSVMGMSGVPRTIGIIQPAVMLSLLCLSRLFVQHWLGGRSVNGNRHAKARSILIYGAGAAGRELAGLMSSTYDNRAVGFLDDDPALQGRQIAGLPVFAVSDLQHAAISLAASEVMLAIPSLGRRRRQEILTELRHANLPVRTLPSYSDLVDGRVTINDIRELSIDEVLGREVVSANPELMRRDVAGRVVMVTGAGGSIGSELCRQIALHEPSRLVLFEQNEFALYTIQQELLGVQASQDFPAVAEIVPVLGSVTDERQVTEAINFNLVQTIYHAAAYKHVPLVEDNALEGIRNNVSGTLTVAEAGIRSRVEKFVLISTDKAVRPTSVMGASKRIAEMCLQSLSTAQKKTTFAVVRFGNVLDSSGSVVPLFRRQIKEGGPITVTHPDVTRYFMTIAEAAQLVIQAGAMTPISRRETESAPVYLLDMGEPIKIMDLAVQMIELSGLSVFDADSNPEGDIEIEVIGLRQGEKLYEELLIGDAVNRTTHPKIHVADEAFPQREELMEFIAGLNECIQKNDEAQLRANLGLRFNTLGRVH